MKLARKPVGMEGCGAEMKSEGFGELDCVVRGSMSAEDEQEMGLIGRHPAQVVCRMADRIDTLKAQHAESERLKDMYRDDCGAALRRVSEIVEAVRRYAAAEISASKLAEVCGLDVAETARGLNSLQEY